jgi:predicted metal-dependent hydrolase
VATDARITVAGISVAVVRKPIRSLRFAVQPPDGEVRVSVPLDVSDDVVRLAIIDKLSWIKRQRATFAAQPRQSSRAMVTGETHYVFGRACRLRVIEEAAPVRIELPRKGEIVVRGRQGLTTRQRERAIQAWYRESLKARVSEFVAKWERLLGVKAAAVGIKRMKTRWGTCNARASRIWLNLELAKKPQRCIEYIVAHELAHLIERTHSARFVAVLDRHMPRWKSYRAELNAEPLAHERWSRRR